MLGAQGLTGTMVDVTLRLRRVHSGYLDVEAEATRSLPETFEAIDRGAREADYTVAWIDCSGDRAGRAVVHHAWYLPPGHELDGAGLDLTSRPCPARRGPAPGEPGVAGAAPVHESCRNPRC